MAEAERLFAVTIERESTWHYQQALWELAEQVMRRNHMLLRVNTLTAMPLGMGSGGKYVAEFDTDAVRRLLVHVDEQHAKITDAMAKANHWAGMCGEPPIQWRPPPRLRGDGGSDD